MPFTEEPLFKRHARPTNPPAWFHRVAGGLGADGTAPLHLELTLKDSRRAFLR